MRSFLLELRNWVRAAASGFGFLPIVIVVMMMLLGTALVHVDRSAGGPHGLDFGFGGDPPTARAVLQTIATALITVAGVTFSIMVVTLQLVSQQFSPRALRGFLADRLNQVVAGAFAGVFAYCLVVLSAVRTARVSDEFVPALSVTVAIILGLATLGLLLVFIHHMSGMIQLSTIAARLGRETLERVESTYPCAFGKSDDEEGCRTLLDRWRASGEPVRVTPTKPGYVEAIDLAGVSPGRHDGCVFVRAVSGRFVSRRDVLAEIWTDSDSAIAHDIEDIIKIGNVRDLGADAAYGLRQLADIAIRALSPGVNDPTTAATCLRYAGAVLEELSCRSIPEVVATTKGDLTVIRSLRGYREYVSLVIAEPGRHAQHDVRVATLVLDIAEAAIREARSVGADGRVALLWKAAEAVTAPAIEHAATACDRMELQQAIGRVRRAAALSPSAPVHDAGPEAANSDLSAL